MNMQQARFNMIEQQVRPWSVYDPHVLALLETVPREDFVPQHLSHLAYCDMEIPIDQGQVILCPRVQARMLQDAKVKKSDQVLEIGTGTGYLTALLAHQAVHVLSLELQNTLSVQAMANLQKAGIHNATVRYANGVNGSPSDGPFDVIILGGSVAQVPRSLLDQLSVGGRLVAVVGQAPMMQTTLWTRSNSTDYTCTQGWDTEIARLHGFDETDSFQF